MRTIICKLESVFTKSSNVFAFNTDIELKIGDTISFSEYGTLLKVIKIFKKSYKYFEIKTKKVSNKFDSKSQTQKEVETLIIRDDNKEIIYETLLNKIYENSYLCIQTCRRNK